MKEEFQNGLSNIVINSLLIAFVNQQTTNYPGLNALSEKFTLDRKGKCRTLSLADVNNTDNMTVEQSIKLAVDAVVFGFENNRLLVLLIKQKYGAMKGNWVLPGGFVLNDESLEEAVQRELKEETGVSVNYLEQLYTFGDPKRDPRFRVVSVAWYALVDPSSISLQADTDAEEVKWFDSKDLPETGYDHQLIITTAIERLRSKLSYQPVGFDLLSSHFLFSDLENLYTTILDKEIDRRNFRKKILSYDLLLETGELSKPKSGRPAKLYKFNKPLYDKLSKEGIHFEIQFA